MFVLTVIIICKTDASGVVLVDVGAGVSSAQPHTTLEASDTSEEYHDNSAEANLGAT